MRNINSFKLTIPPYTPEFNPVEHLFSKLKLIASDGAERSDLLELTGYIVENLNKIPKNTFISYF